MVPVVLAGRFFIALVLLLAGAAKIRRQDELARAIGGYRLLPQALVRPVAIVLPWVEVALGTGLALGVATRVVALAIAVLLAVFTGAVAVSLARGLRIDCGCFGVAQGDPANGWTLARNIGLMAVTIMIVIYPNNDLSWSDGLAILIATSALFLAGTLIRHTVVSLRTGGAPR